jgi:hypothetical protein
MIAAEKLWQFSEEQQNMEINPAGYKSNHLTKWCLSQELKGGFTLENL